MGLPGRDAELVQIVDAALADAARRAGDWLVCRVGCTQCCHGAFAINGLDAARLAAGMHALREGQSALAADIELRARGWIATHGAQFPGDLETGSIGETEVDRQRFEGFANETACPALDPATGRCDVYAWRPMTCRVFGPPVPVETNLDGVAALAHCELCFVGVAEADVKACQMAVPHELEAQVLEELGEAGETVVAFALLR